MKPIRVQRSRAKGWTMPPKTIYVGRPGIFGNPFLVSNTLHAYSSHIGCPHVICSDIDKVIEVYEWYLLNTERGKATVRLAQIRLHGINLACWCNLSNPCHADILLKLANPETDE